MSTSTTYHNSVTGSNKDHHPTTPNTDTCPTNQSKKEVHGKYQIERYKKEQDQHDRFSVGLGPRDPLQAGQKVLSGLQGHVAVLENMGLDMSAQVNQKPLTTDKDHNKKFK